jgi:hypothetical protein
MNRKQRQTEIIKNLSNTISLEKEKSGGGNQELINVLSKKLEQVKDAL